MLYGRTKKCFLLPVIFFFSQNIGGAQALYTVESSCGKVAEIELDGVEREFFIQAEEYIWNYAPSGMDKWNGQDLLLPGGYDSILKEVDVHEFI